jgi:hypothetical protein
LPRVVARLIWSVQNLDDAAMTANVWSTRPAPAPSLAGNAGYANATCERCTAALVNPRQSSNPHHGRSVDHRAHFDGCQRVEGPRPPNQAPTTLGTPKRQVLAS